MTAHSHRAGTGTPTEVGDQSGRTVLVTGASGGLGLVVATELARHGATVLLGCRDPDRGATAVAAVRAAAAGPAPELVALDLADLTSIRAAATLVRERTGDDLDVLVNNAGTRTPTVERTRTGIELQWATNHLGHAALTWLLYPALATVTGSRVVTVTDLAYRRARISPVRLEPDTRGDHITPAAAYSLSKVAGLLFALELHRRLRIDDPATLSVAAHPGTTTTALNHTILPALPPAARALTRLGTDLVGTSAVQGAHPVLHAATAPGVRSGGVYGPSGLGQHRGAPGEVRINDIAQDERLAKLVWALTATQTGIEPAPSHVHPSGSSNLIAHG